MIDVPNHMSPLTAKGWEQARGAGIFIRDFYHANPPKSKIRLWVSPFIRATQTAMAINEIAGDLTWDVSRRGETMQFDDRLRERESVYFEGYTHEENSQKFPEQLDYFLRVRKTRGGRYYARPYGGESFADLSLRIQSFLQDMYHDIERGITEHVIVSHGNMLMTFALTLTKAHPFFADAIDVAPNAGIHLFDLDPVTQRYEDYGLIYHAEKNIRLMEKPKEPIRRDLKKLLSELGA